jgi:Raf kinase inhibitor-like YbhB/YbcL family protein
MENGAQAVRQRRILIPQHHGSGGGSPMQTLPAIGWISEKSRSGKMLLGSLAGTLAMLVGLAACGRSAAIGEGKPTLELTSTSFRTGGDIPKKFTCDGSDASPQLAWGAPPGGTRSFVLIAVDPDAPMGTFVHWVLYEVPPDKHELAEDLPKQEQLPDGSRQGQNDFDKIGYGGPCPPSGTHRYVFALYALDTKLNLAAGATRKQVENTLKDHVLARGELIGRYHH